MQSPRTVITILKMNQIGGLLLPTCKIYYKALVVKTVWRYIDQWDG